MYSDASLDVKKLEGILTDMDQRTWRKRNVYIYVSVIHRVQQIFRAGASTDRQD